MLSRPLQLASLAIGSTGKAFLAMFNGGITRQVLMAAYIDNFSLLTFVMGIAELLCFLLKPVVGRGNKSRHLAKA